MGTVVETSTSSSTTCPDAREAGAMLTMENICAGKKPGLANTPCLSSEVDTLVAVLEQAGMNVTKGYQGTLDTNEAFGDENGGQYVPAGRMPINESYWKKGLCPVNVHWHLGAEHLSVGEYDDEGSGPSSDSASYRRKLQGGEEIRE